MSFIGILFSMQDSKLDVTIGPYETYEDKLFGYKVIIENKALRQHKYTIQISKA
jgi:hypothetical protein